MTQPITIAILCGAVLGLAITVRILSRRLEHERLINEPLRQQIKDRETMAGDQHRRYTHLVNSYQQVINENQRLRQFQAGIRGITPGQRCRINWKSGRTNEYTVRGIDHDFRMIHLEYADGREFWTPVDSISEIAFIGKPPQPKLEERTKPAEDPKP